jgi:hypothetical protein
MLPVTKIPGLAYICTMCEHMSSSEDKGLNSCGKKDCGGPSVGKCFPEYKGPLETIFLDYCFRCGDPSTKAFSVDSGRRLGVCDPCLKKLLDKAEAIV